MTQPSRRYYALLASLPALGKDFTHPHPPISRPRLEARLQQLHPDDLAAVLDMEEVLRWTRQTASTSDEAVLDQFEEVMARWENPVLHDILSARYTFRTMFAALRMRRQGLDPPDPHSRWGVGPWLRRMAANWERHDLGMGIIFPWMNELATAFEREDPRGIEKVLLDVGWGHLDRLASQYFFSFEAVLIYVARWDIVERWTRTDTREARPRFEKLLDEVVGEHGRIRDTAAA